MWWSDISLGPVTLFQGLDPVSLGFYQVKAHGVLIVCSFWGLASGSSSGVRLCSWPWHKECLVIQTLKLPHAGLNIPLPVLLGGI